MTTTPDAVEALVHSCEKYNYGKSASKEPRGESIIMSDIIEKHLASQGFTIARAEPAMSEAELLLHCQSLAMEFADDNLRKDCEQAAFELAKKYRGQS